MRRGGHVQRDESLAVRAVRNRFKPRDGADGFRVGAGDVWEMLGLQLSSGRRTSRGSCVEQSGSRLLFSFGGGGAVDAAPCWLVDAAIGDARVRVVNSGHVRPAFGI